MWPFLLLISLPTWITTRLAPDLYLYVAFIHDCEVQIRSIMKGSKDKLEGKRGEETHPTLFHELLQQKYVPDIEKSVSHLVQEAQIVVSAGTETASWFLSVITFHLLSNSSILQRLRNELCEAIPDPDKMIPVEKLEQLPYLTACIQEGLRLSYGLTSRLARGCPDEVMVFRDGEKEWVIPPGVSYFLLSRLSSLS
jgi:cytochrome P450